MVAKPIASKQALWWLSESGNRRCIARKIQQRLHENDDSSYRLILEFRTARHQPIRLPSRNVGKSPSYTTAKTARSRVFRNASLGHGADTTCVYRGLSAIGAHCRIS